MATIIIGDPMANNFTMAAGTETQVQFSDLRNSVEIYNYGPGIIYANLFRTAVAADPNCLKLAVGQSEKLYKLDPFNTVSIVSTDASVVQVIS
jgi:hypothetical protein